MELRALLGNIRGAVLNWAIKWGVGYLLTQLEDPKNRGKMQALGATLGRRLGQLIPSEEADGFLAAFTAGVTEGLNEKNGDTEGGGSPLAGSSASK